LSAYHRSGDIVFVERGVVQRCVLLLIERVEYTVAEGAETLVKDEPQSRDDFRNSQ